MGIRDWFAHRKEAKRAALSTPFKKPELERLEPRVLLSADLPGVDPSLLEAARAEQAIVVDLHEAGADGTVAASLPNLTPYQPSGWSDKIVVSTRTGTRTDDSPLSPADVLYVDWAVINNGSVATGATFSVGLYVDGALRTSWSVNPPLIPVRRLCRRLPHRRLVERFAHDRDPQRPDRSDCRGE